MAAWSKGMGLKFPLLSDANLEISKVTLHLLGAKSLALAAYFNDPCTLGNGAQAMHGFGLDGAYGRCPHGAWTRASASLVKRGDPPYGRCGLSVAMLVSIDCCWVRFPPSAPGLPSLRSALDSSCGYLALLRVQSHPLQR